MASPHVAGLMAYLISAEGKTSPYNMIQKIRNYAVKGALSDLRESNSMKYLKDLLKCVTSRPYRQPLGTEQKDLR